jgi:IS30 family transposase
MNGLLRDYFPKHTDLRGHPADRLVAVAAEVNARPRKTLEWATQADSPRGHLTPV